MEPLACAISRLRIWEGENQVCERRQRTRVDTVVDSDDELPSDRPEELEQRRQTGHVVAEATDREHPSVASQHARSLSSPSAETVHHQMRSPRTRPYLGIICRMSAPSRRSRALTPRTSTRLRFVLVVATLIVFGAGVMMLGFQRGPASAADQPS